jgi:hypothetical protein
METKARYGDWVAQVDEKPAFSLRKAVLRRDPPDYRKSFIEAGESFDRLLP